MTAETGLTLCVCFLNFSLKMSPSEGPGTSHEPNCHTTVNTLEDKFLRPQQTHWTHLNPSKRRAECLPLSLRATCRQPPTDAGQVFPDRPKSCPDES